MNDGSAPWIKIITRIFEDPKIIAIEQVPEAYGILILWFKLLTLAGEQNRGGSIYFTESVPFTADLLAAKWRCKPMLVQMAFGVFQKYGMISIDAEGTIFISNWAKYQNEKGLANIRDRSLVQLENVTPVTRDSERDKERDRELATARQRRHREKVKQGQNGASRSVTVTPQKKIETENQKRERTLSPSLSTSGERSSEGQANDTREIPDVIQHAEAKLMIGKLALEAFRITLRPTQWPLDMEQALDRECPIPRADLLAVDWLYRLSLDDHVWKTTMRRQSINAVMENWSKEVQKAKNARRQLELNGHFDADEEEALGTGWTEARERAVREIFGKDDLPRTFAELGASMCRRVDEWTRDQWPVGGKEIARKLYGDQVPLPERYSQLSGSVRSEIKNSLAKQSPKENTDKANEVRKA